MLEFEEIRAMVVRGEEIQNSSSPLERLCWSGIQGIYLRYAAKQLTKEEALKNRDKLNSDYALALEQYQKYAESEKTFQNNIQRAGELRAEMIKAESEQEAFQIALEIIAKLTGEETTEQIILSKLRGE